MTEEELLEGIGRALKARDMEAAAGLTRRLAVIAPDKAQAILDAVHGRVTITLDGL